jgi:hypothetical protein
MIMGEEKPRCSRGDDCESCNPVGCSGCGFQHFDLVESAGSQAIDFLKQEYFLICSKNRKGHGGRVSLDSSFKELVKKAKDVIEGFPKITELTESKDLTDKLCVGGRQCDFQVKCDCSFSFNHKHIFVEIKGYGDDTNSILSAITAAQLVSCGTNFTTHRYYYLGSTSSVAKNGLSRQNFLDEKRTKVTPYVRWAEDKGFIKFYGVRDIEQMLKDIRDYLLRPESSHNEQQTG